VAEAERRCYSQRPSGVLEPGAAVPVARAPDLPLERCQPLRQVRAADIARLLHTETVGPRSLRRWPRSVRRNTSETQLGGRVSSGSRTLPLATSSIIPIQGPAEACKVVTEA
jgi:hypothetical protein